uniref:Uncharacterized protein n=1 Tax=Anguilla anguilla TaxID=7936 RepID=A0A0E9U2U6_ANGAN
MRANKLAVEMMEC